MSTPSQLSAPEKTILVYGALGALLALALHAVLPALEWYTLLHNAWLWHSTFATLFAIQWVWLVPLAGAMLAGMRSGKRWLLALAAYALVLPALHAYGLMPWLDATVFPSRHDSTRTMATVITAVSGFMLLPLIQALDPCRPGWDYPAVFRAAWRNTVKLVLAAGLTLAVWLLLQATDTMFDTLGITAVGKVVQSTFFLLGVMPLVLAACLVGMHRRPQLADTLQRTWLTLTAWLLPLVALIGIAFVLALAARLALDLRTDTLSAGTLIAFCALWIKLINSAWQDSPDAPPFGPRLRAVLRVAACGLLPLMLAALYGLVVRVQQYGWTMPRIWGMYAAVLLTLYALGYAWAAMAPRRFHAILGATNIAAAFCALTLLAMVNTPLLSPHRIAFDSQEQRLTDGRNASEKPDPSSADAFAQPLPKPANLQVYPAGSAVPDAWWRIARQESPYHARQCLRAEQAAANANDPALNRARCWLILADITDDGADDLVLYVPDPVGTDNFVIYQKVGEDTWSRLPSVVSRRHTGEYGPDVDIGHALAQGQVHTEPRQGRDLIISGQRLPMH